MLLYYLPLATIAFLKEQYVGAEAIDMLVNVTNHCDVLTHSTTCRFSISKENEVSQLRKLFHTK